MSFEWIIFFVIILHFIVGFDWLFYKLEIEKSEDKNKKDTTSHENKSEIK